MDSTVSDTRYPAEKIVQKNKQNPLGFWSEQSVNGPIDTRF